MRMCEWVWESDEAGQVHRAWAEVAGAECGDLCPFVAAALRRPQQQVEPAA